MATTAARRSFCAELRQLELTSPRLDSGPFKDLLADLQMSGIRPCTRDDLPQVAILYEQVMRSGTDVPAPGLVPFLERVLFDHPWADPELPSLVYEQDGAIAAFLGSHVRRFAVDGSTIRLACSGQFVSSPTVQKRGAGALLLRKYLAGPQELTITDGPSDAVGRMWERLKGQRVWLGSLSWTRVFRPWSASGVLQGMRDNSAWQAADRLIGSQADAVLARAARGYLRVPDPDTRSEALSAAAMLELLPDLARHWDIVPAYDRPFVDWLFAEMAAVSSRGPLVKHLVVAPDGRPLGWYVGYLPPGGIAQVMQVMAAPDDAEAVVHHLLHHAQAAGVAAIQGRLEPHLFDAVLKLRCKLRRSHPALIHSSAHPEIIGAVFQGRALLTRMEGEWWMTCHVDPLD
jgi:hypothetical protein